MTPQQIEQAVFDLEEVRIVVRADLRQNLGDYSYARKAAETTSITDWLDQRIRPILLDSKQNIYDVVVVDGKGAIPHGRTKMATLRASYER